MIENMFNYSKLFLTTASTNHYYGVWRNSYYSPAPLAPNNILIGSESFSLITSFSKTIDGETKTVYCFDFMQSTLIQDTIDDINSDNGIDEGLIVIRIRNGTTVLQNNVLYINKISHDFTPQFPL